MPSPIALFAFNRPVHLKATIEALSRNTLAIESDLFIFSDGPRTPDDTAAVNAVRAMAREQVGFASITVVERVENLGLAQSVILGVSSLLERYEQIIVMEDDLVTSPHFLTFLNTALAHYREDPKAFSVTGFSYPEKYFQIPADYRYHTFAVPRCCSNGWGTWRDRWQRIDWHMGYFPAFAQDASTRAAFNSGGHDLSSLLEMQFQGQIDSWAIRFCYAHFAQNMHCIYPTQTLVRNIGFDFSGIHSVPNPKFEHSQLNQQWLPSRFAPAALLEPRITQAFRSLFIPSKPSFMRRAQDRARQLWERIKRKPDQIRKIFNRIVMRPKRDASILFVNTYQNYGGAARAAYRTFEGVRQKLPDVKLLTLFRGEADPDIYGLAPNTVRGSLAQQFGNRDISLLAKHPKRTNTYFSAALRANPLRIRLSRFRAKLIHLHWIGHSLLSVDELGLLASPVVWTLHDAWAFTGGCHTVGICDGFTRQCGRCPQLGSSADYDLSRVVFDKKLGVFNRLNITIVAPSRWLGELAARSTLLAGRRIVVIPNGLDTSTFKPLDKATAGNYFGLSPDRPVILFAAHWLADPNKGADLLLTALAQWGCPCHLLTFGGGSLPKAPSANVNYHPLGNLTDNASLALAYSAAHIFVCASRQENLPNTVAEALACGTPCAAFRIGGLPEMIEHQSNGWLADPFDTAQLAQGLTWLTQHPHQDQLRAAAREKAMAEYDLEVMTQRYLELYDEVLTPSPTQNEITPSRFPKWAQPLIPYVRPIHRALRPRLGMLVQHPPHAPALDLYQPIPTPSTSNALPRIALVTPSFNQATFLERTLRSVLNQQYPALDYYVQDGGSTDGSIAKLEAVASQLGGWHSGPDRGQAHAINLGFEKTTGDLMGWLNSDDVLLPGALHSVAQYFATHSEIDVIYGHRLLIDENDAQIGTWIMPPHEDDILSWADFIPQETMFWRRSIWDKSGAHIDESFHFAIDWDLILRFRRVGARFARIPRFIGGFRVHGNQKTSTDIASTGTSEMARLRQGELGRTPTKIELDQVVRRYLLRHLPAEWFWRLRMHLSR